MFNVFSVCLSLPVTHTVSLHQIWMNPWLQLLTIHWARVRLNKQKNPVWKANITERESKACFAGFTVFQIFVQHWSSCDDYLRTQNQTVLLLLLELVFCCCCFCFITSTLFKYKFELKLLPSHWHNVFIL